MMPPASAGGPSLGIAGGAQAATVDFESFATNTSINSVVFTDGTTASVTTNSNRSVGNGGTNQAVVFDTDNPTGNDNDLAAPFPSASGGEASTPGNILIIAGPQNGNLTLPDDDAAGGTIVFEFDRLVTFLGFDYFDTEAGSNRLIFSTDTGFNSGNLVAGNGKYDTFSTSIFGVKSVTFDLGGSGGIDNLKIAAPVPVPAALPLMLAGLGGLGFMARRKRKAG